MSRITLGQKVSAELLKLGEKFKDESYGQKFTEVGNDIKLLEDGMCIWCDDDDDDDHSGMW